MINKYIIFSLLAIFIVYLSYIINFYFFLGAEISSDSAAWGQLGDYAGGVLNPILSFISIVLLIKSLRLQNDANLSLRNELANNERAEKIKSFETLFFSMINSQRKLLGTLRIHLIVNNEPISKIGIEAVLEIEDKIEEIRSKTINDDAVTNFLEAIDQGDQIYSIARSFHIAVKTISEKLSDSEGFSPEERKAHFLTLINFTDFTQLRLIMISVQFMDYPPMDYLKNNQEFIAALKEVGLNYNSY